MAEAIRRQSELREAVGIFSDAKAVERAVQELLTRGFDQADISLLATERTARDKLGAYSQDTHAAEDDPQAPRQDWISPEARTEGRSALAGMLGYLGALTVAGVVFATGGAAAAAVVAGVVGGGATAAVGATLGRRMDRKIAEAIEYQLDHGGIVLWVRLQRENQVADALEVLRNHGAQDVHIHQFSMAP